MFSTPSPIFSPALLFNPITVGEIHLPIDLNGIKFEQFKSCEETLDKPTVESKYSSEQQGYIKARRWSEPLTAEQIAKLP